jgi:hypothetical protein
MTPALVGIIHQLGVTTQGQGGDTQPQPTQRQRYGWYVLGSLRKIMRTTRLGSQ